MRTPVLVVALAAVLGGCAWMQVNMMGHLEAKVEIKPVDPEGAPIVYLVKSSGSTGPTVEGVKNLNLQEPERAGEAFDKAASETPEDANAHFLAGLAAELVGKFPKSKDHYDRAYKLRTDVRYAESYRRAKEKLAAAGGS
jgi:tetratricopeptide (TPR) repeat protein